MNKDWEGGERREGEIGRRERWGGERWGEGRDAWGGDGEGGDLGERRVEQTERDADGQVGQGGRTGRAARARGPVSVPSRPCRPHHLFLAGARPRPVQGAAKQRTRRWGRSSLGGPLALGGSRGGGDAGGAARASLPSSAKWCGAVGPWRLRRCAPGRVAPSRTPPAPWRFLAGPGSTPCPRQSDPRQPAASDCCRTKKSHRKEECPSRLWFEKKKRKCPSG